MNPEPTPTTGDFPAPDFPAPPTNPLLPPPAGSLAPTKRQRRRARDRARKQATRGAETQALAGKQAMADLLQLRLREKREARTGVTQRKVRKMATDANLDVRSGDDATAVLRRMGVTDPSLLEKFQDKSFTAAERAKMQTQVAGMDPGALASAVEMLKAH